MSLIPRIFVVAILASAALGQATAPTSRPADPFAFTTPVDVAATHDLPADQLNDDPATQLKGLCSLAEFRALPANDRHVYGFEPWPGEKDNLGVKSYCFNFRLDDGVPGLKVALAANCGAAGGPKSLTRAKDASGYLLNYGCLDWGASCTHQFRFDKPVVAFGVVLKSNGDVDLRRFAWAKAKDNGYPMSYVLADGSVVQLGEREARGAVIKGDTRTFLGVIDRTGRGIVAVNYMLKGLAGNKAQSISIAQLAFATVPTPATASVINLRSSCDFVAPDSVTPAPAPAADGFISADTFRFIVANHRYVYGFDTWPTKGGATGEFAFDLKGKGETRQKITLSSTEKNAKLTQATLTDEHGQSYHALGGLGDIGNNGTAEQTIKFAKPVWSCGVTYQSPADATLDTSSYTLTDGTVVNLKAGGTIAANSRTFVGVMDDSDKGIASVTFRVHRSAVGQQLYIRDLAFAFAGPPPGDWKLTLEDNFDGDKLNDKNWTTGYIFKDIINSELQAFTPENVVVADGKCTIKVEHREAVNTDRTGRTGVTQQFASGAFTSFDKFTQTYGYFEARIKMPHARGAGVWPAFWVLPDRGRDFPEKTRTAYMTKENGRGMEIDIFEFMPNWKRADGTFPIHVGCIWNYGKVTPENPAPHGYGDYGQDNDGWGPGEIHFPDLDTKYHTYGLYWSPQRLIWYVDSKPIYRAKNPDKMPNVNHYFLFNIALSGNGWGKTPDKKNPTMQQIIEDMPNAMEIDYFRAYSGVLEEAMPTAPGDDPRTAETVTKYTPPATPASAPATKPAEPKEAPAAPANSQISTPSGG